MSDASGLMGDLTQSLATSGPGRRDDMLVKITDLFEGVSHLLKDDGVETFGAIFVSLIPGCSEQAKAYLSETIAPNPRAPAFAVRHLAFDDSILVARPVICLSPLLLDDHLMALATVKSPAHLLALCERATLAPGVTDVILSRANGEIMIALASNVGACFSERGLSRLAEAALDDGGLQDVVSQRADLAERFIAADGAGEAARPFAGQLPTATTAPATAELSPAASLYPTGRQAAPEPDVDPSGDRISATDRQLRELLAADQIDAALGALAHKLGIAALPVAKAFALDIHGGFLAYARAAPINWDTTLRFLMKRYSAGQVTPRLQRAEADFRKLAIADARRVASLLAQHAPKQH